MDKKEVELGLLSLEYQRQVSRAHTIFSTFFNMLLAVIFGVFGVMIGLVEIRAIAFNKLYFLLALFITLLLNGLIMMFVLYKMYGSRLERKSIEYRIMSI